MRAEGAVDATRAAEVVVCGEGVKVSLVDFGAFGCDESEENESFSER